ncbi:ion channel [Okeanomitos corallinicola TIOX110]|uniref:Ion channel n=1 Tax=Okeanomitos corallinicola TIOX110 TaxID=3133117 RepID=A0ABZ2UMN2_9CYAN
MINKNWYKQAWKFLQRENLDRVLLVITILVIFSSITYSIVENKTIIDSVWWTIVTVTTVGYGDISPVTLPGRLVAIVNMIVGIGVLAILSASLASFLVSKKIKEDLGMSAYKFENHIIVCEWNYRAEVIIKEFRQDSDFKEAPIILIADIDRKPIEDENLYFIKGKVSDETLIRANINKAKTAIILGDDKLEHNARDATTILSTLIVESLASSVYTIVELMNAAYIDTCKKAHADEIIVSSHISSMLISQAAINHGITYVISDLLSFQDGANKLYKVPVPRSKIGMPFIEAFVHIKQTYQSTVVALQKGLQGEVMCNPSNQYKLNNQDYLIIVATESSYQEIQKSHLR